MNFLIFLKEKAVFIFVQLVLIVFIFTLFDVYKIDYYAYYLVTLLITLSTIIVILYEYFKKSNYYRRLYNILDRIDKKQYIAEFLEKPDFLEAEILCDILKQTTKAMNDQIAIQKIAEEEYKEYIETWIHEIKMPIACIDLICKNNPDNTTVSISEELVRIDNFIEQALFYARSSVLEKDFVIKSTDLENLIKSVVKKYSKELISSKVNLNLGDLKYTVYVDSKWMIFILGQIISNSIKYRS
ncbi:MAG: sensor histidine kinase, partial [Proteocatella sp.]